MSGSSPSSPLVLSSPRHTQIVEATDASSSPTPDPSVIPSSVPASSPSVSPLRPTRTTTPVRSNAETRRTIINQLHSRIPRKSSAGAVSSSLPSLPSEHSAGDGTESLEHQAEVESSAPDSDILIVKSAAEEVHHDVLTETDAASDLASLGTPIASPPGGVTGPSITPPTPSSALASIMKSAATNVERIVEHQQQNGRSTTEGEDAKASPAASGLSKVDPVVPSLPLSELNKHEEQDAAEARSPDKGVREEDAKNVNSAEGTDNHSVSVTPTSEQASDLMSDSSSGSRPHTGVSPHFVRVILI